MIAPTLQHKYIFRPPLHRIAIIWSVALLAVIIMALFSTSIINRSPYLFGFFAVLLLSVGLYFLYIYTFKTYIEINDTHLRIKGGFDMAIEWNMTQKFGWSVRGANQYWGIYTRQNLSNKSPFLSSLYLQDHFIPLSHIVGRPPHKRLELMLITTGVDLEKFTETEFAQALRFHAPHLFEGSET